MYNKLNSVCRTEEYIGVEQKEYSKITLGLRPPPPRTLWVSLQSGVLLKTVLSLPLSRVTQRRMFSVCVKEMSRPGPVLNCLYPVPSTPIELITPSPGDGEIRRAEARQQKCVLIKSSSTWHFLTPHLCQPSRSSFLDWKRPARWGCSTSSTALLCYGHPSRHSAPLSGSSHLPQLLLWSKVVPWGDAGQWMLCSERTNKIWATFNSV